jgi:hypothetical protein
MTQSQLSELNDRPPDHRGSWDRFIPAIVAAWIVLMAVLVVLVLAVGTAFAKKPVPPPEPADGMCGEVVYTLTEGPELIAPCIDILSMNETAWAFDFVITGKRLEQAKSFMLNIRESHPGDFCWRSWGDPRELDTDPRADVVAFTVRTDTYGVSMGETVDGIIPPSTGQEVCMSGGLEDPTVDSMVATLAVQAPPKGVDITVTVHPVADGA